VSAGGIGPIDVVGRIEGGTEVGDLELRQRPPLFHSHHDPRGDYPLIAVLVGPSRPEEIANEDSATGPWVTLAITTVPPAFLGYPLGRRRPGRAGGRRVHRQDRSAQIFDDAFERARECVVGIGPLGQLVEIVGHAASR
jgi:hypothetical protein